MKTTKRIPGILLALTLVFTLALPALAEDVSYIPNITQQPNKDTYVRTGLGFTLRVEASVPEGGALSYQWCKDGKPIEGATQSSYKATASEVSAYTYTVVVTNTYTLNGETLTASVTSNRAQVIAFGGLIWTFGQIFTTLTTNPSNWFSGPAWAFIGLIYNYVMMFSSSGGLGNLLPVMDV